MTQVSQANPGSGTRQEQTVRVLFVLFLCCTAHFSTHWQTFQAAFFWDDFSHLLEFKQIQSGESLWTHLWIPMNDHYVPWIKLGYFTFFSLFGHEVFPFHLALFVSQCLLLIAAYGLLNVLTRNQGAASTGTFLLAISHHYDQALYWIGASHIFLSAVFFVVSLWILATPRHSRLILVLFFFTTLFSFSFFSIGIFMALWLPVWGWIFRPSKSMKIYLLIGVFTWIMSALPYALGVGQILSSFRPGGTESHHSHYFFETIKAFRWTLQGFWQQGFVSSLHQPGVCRFFLVLSGLILLSLPGRFRKWPLKFHLFFGSWTLLSLLFPFLFRTGMGSQIIEWERYYAYPMIGAILYFSGLAHSLWDGLIGPGPTANGSFRNCSPWLGLILALSLLVVSLNHPVPPYPSHALQRQFEKSLQTAVHLYFEKNPQKSALTLKSKEVETIFCFSWPNSNYFRIFLKKDVFDRLHFGAHTDPGFIELLYANQLEALLILVEE